MNTSGSKRRAIPKESAIVGSDGGGGDGGGCRKRLCRPSPSHQGPIKQIPSELYFKIGVYFDWQTLRKFCIAIGPTDGDKVWKDCLLGSSTRGNSSLQTVISGAGQVCLVPNNPYAVDFLNRICPSPSPSPPSNAGVKKYRTPDLCQYSSYSEADKSISVEGRRIKLVEKLVSVLGRVDANHRKRTEMKLGGIEALMSATENVRMFEWGHEAADVVIENVRQRTGDPNLSQSNAFTNVTVEDVTDKRLRLNRGIPALVKSINPN